MKKFVSLFAVIALVALSAFTKTNDLKGIK